MGSSHGRTNCTNGFMPTGQKNFDIILSAKGFFVVQFYTTDDYQKFVVRALVLGSMWLFVTQWFPDFDRSTMDVSSKMSVWVRFPNLALPFWHLLVFKDIGNALASYLKHDFKYPQQGLFTYAQICVETDLSKGLPERMVIKHGKI